jgi:hypothetical protein
MQEIASHVKELKKLQILRFYDKYLAPNAPCRWKLCVRVVAKQHEDALEKMDAADDNNDSTRVISIEDPAEFKRSMPLFAMPEKVDVQVVDLGIKKS